jgi:hypothetical protein
MLKKVAGVFGVVILFIWAVGHFSRNSGEPTMEEAAEKLGRLARQRLEQKNQPPVKGLQITETAASASGAEHTGSAAPAAPTSPQDLAKVRLNALLMAWQGQAKGNVKLTTAVVWARGLELASLEGLTTVVEEFDRFRGERGLPEKIGSYEIHDVMRRANGAESFTAIDVTIDGVMYHFGVPDGPTPISWTF